MGPPETGRFCLGGYPPSHRALSTQTLLCAYPGAPRPKESHPHLYRAIIFAPSFPHDEFKDSHSRRYERFRTTILPNR